MAAQGIPDAVSFHEEQETSIPTLTVQSTNLMANFDVSSYPPSVQIIIEGLHHSVLFNAFTIFKPMPLRLVSLAFSTARYLRNEDSVKFEVVGGKKFSISKSSFLRLLGLPTDGIFITPTAEELVEMFNSMGYSPPLTKISHFKKNKLPIIWNVFFTFFKRCLTGRKGGQDSASQLFLQCLYGVYNDERVDFGSILWHEFIESLKISTKDVEISCHRFWSVILESVYREKGIIFDADEEPQMVSISLSIHSKLYDQVDNPVVGVVPETMLNRIPATSTILLDYRSPVIKPIPHVQVTKVAEVKRNKKRKEKMTTESPIKQTKRSKKGKEVAESHTPNFEKIHRSRKRRQTLNDDSDDDIHPLSHVFSIASSTHVINPIAEEREVGIKQTKRSKKGKEVAESHTPNFEKIHRSRKRRQTLNDDSDDDIHPLSHVFSIASSTHVINPIAEEREVGILNAENMERDVLNLEDEPAQEEQVLVRTTIVNEVVNEEEMGGEESRIENAMVCDEVAQGEIITTGAEETALVVSEVESEVVTTEVSAMIVNEAEIVNEAIVTEGNAMIVNEAEGVNEEVETENATTEVNAQVEHEVELEATAEYRAANLNVVNDSEQVTNEECDLSCSVPPPVLHTISEPILNTISEQIPNITSEPIPNTLSETSIYSDLRNLDVRIPEISPVIPQTTQQTEKEIMFENISFTGEDLVFDDEELDMAPIDLMQDDNENVDENELMSIKQFRILNRKLNMILRISERPADLSTSRESELEKVSLEWNEKYNLLNAKMSNLGERFDGFKDTMKKDNAQLKNEVLELKNEVKNLDDEVRKLNSEIAQLSAKNVEELKLRIDEMNKEKSTIQKALDDALAHIQFLEPSIKIYDQKELADDYNMKVVQHVELVQRDLMSKLAPLQKLLSVLPKIPVSKTAVPVNISSSKSSPTVRMDYPLFSVTSQTITQPTSTPILIPQRILQKAVVIGSSAPMQTTSTVVTTYAGSSSNKGKEIMEELSEEERRKRDLDASEKLRQQLSLMRQGELFKNTGETKIWSEVTIRDLAFGEDNFMSFLPKQSYNTQLEPGMQLDLPLTPKLFTVKCFKIPSAVKFSTNDYNEKLIRFYGRIGLEESQVWSLSAIRKIIKVEKGDLFENTFQNFVFTVERGDSKTYTFTLADLPVLNPMDLIQILKLLHLLEKIDVTILINHLRSLLHTYVSEIATKDMIVAKALGKDIVRPLVSCDGLSKFTDGKIIQQPEWGIVYSATVKGKLIKRLFRIDDKGKFSNSHILAILKRMVAFDDNSVKELSEVSDHLNWTMGVRRVMLEAIPLIFNP